MVAVLVLEAVYFSGCVAAIIFIFIIFSIISINFMNYLLSCRYVTATTTFASGVGYVFAKDTFKLLKQGRH